MRVGSKKTRMDWLRFMRGRCYGCGGTDHTKSSCSRVKPDILCSYCRRPNHFADVCMDKFMGLDKDRGLNARGSGQQAPQARTVGAVETQLQQQQQQPSKEDKQMQLAAQLDNLDIKLKEINALKAQVEKEFADF